MKKAFTYSAIVLLLAATACNKTDSDLSGDNSIRFAIASPATRALVENDTDLQAQTIKVYDLLDGTNYFVADETVKYVDNAWTFQSGKAYTWKTGTHKFFAHTGGVLSSANVLDVELNLTTEAANQEDILYSNIVTKTAEQAKTDNYIPVSLTMDHIFAAVAIDVVNCTSSDVVVNSVSKPAIPNSWLAQVDYSGTAPVVTYGNTDKPAPSISGAYVAGTFAGATVPSSALVDVLAQSLVPAGTETNPAAPTYFVVWPQTIAEDAITVTVNYTVGENTKEATVKIPASVWQAGNKYLYNLNIYPTEIQLTFEVAPWNKVEVGTIDTKTGSINMSNVTWMNSKVGVNGVETNTVNIGGREVTMYYHPTVDGATYTANNGYFPAQGYFTVNYPNSGLFKIDLIPAYGQTAADLDASRYEIFIYKKKIDPETGEVVTETVDGKEVPVYEWAKHNPAVGETITNDTVYFQVRAASGQDGVQHKAQIDIWFKPTGSSSEWISAYSEIRANYALIIPATN